MLRYLRGGHNFIRAKLVHLEQFILRKLPFVAKLQRVHKRAPLVVIVALILIAVPSAVFAGTVVYRELIAEEPEEVAMIASNKVDPENYLFFAIDDLKDWLGPNKPDWLQTPNLDALIGESVFFENALSTAAQCNPSRTSLWTGLRPSSSGLQDNMHDITTVSGATVKDSWRSWFADPNSAAYQNYGEEASEIATLFDHFRNSGYYIGGAGKVFHQNTQAREEQWDAYYPNEQLPPQFANPLNVPGPDDFGVVEDLSLSSGRAATEADLADTKTRNNTIKIMNELPGDKPFLVATGFWRPHNPNYVPQRFIDQYIDATTGDYSFGDADQVVAYLEGDQNDVPNPTPAARDAFVRDTILSNAENPDMWNDFLAHYAASISFVDEQVGAIVNELKQSGLYDSTNIVLWSDHGYSVGEKGHIRKGTLWRETTDISLSIRVPGVTDEGSVSGAPITSVDLFPTLTELAGLEQPSDVVRDGRSFARLVGDPGDNWPWLGRSEMTTSPAWQTYGDREQAVSLRNKNGDTYIEHFIGNDDAPEFNTELYDINVDPNEQTNLLAPAAVLTEAVVEKASAYSSIVSKGLGPQNAPVIDDSSVELLSTQNATSIELNADDADGDYLEFYLAKTPENGDIFFEDIKVSAGDRIPSAPGRSAAFEYRISDEDRDSVEEDVFTVSVFDGIAFDDAVVSLDIASSLVLDCDASRLFTIRGNSTASSMLMHRVDLSDDEPQFTQIVFSEPIPYGTNAIGYSAEDESIYGVQGVALGAQDEPRSLIAMRKNGLYEKVASFDALLESAGYSKLSTVHPDSGIYDRLPLVSGDVFENTYYVVINTNVYGENHPFDTDHEAYLVAIDLDDFNSVTVNQITYSNYEALASPEGTGDPYFGDIAIHPYEGVGYYFDRLAEKFGKLNLQTGKATLYGASLAATDEAFVGGALMFSEEGRFYAYGRNDATENPDLDTLFEVNQATGQISPIVVSDSADFVDGAGCFTKSSDDGGDGGGTPVISQPGQFECSPGQVFLTRGTQAEGVMSLDSILISDGDVSIETIVDKTSIPYRLNATAYNSKDRFIYGVHFDNNRTDSDESGKQVVQVKSDGEVNEVLDLDSALVGSGYPQLSTLNPASDIYFLIPAAAGTITNNKYYIVLSAGTQGSTPSPSTDRRYDSYLLEIDLSTFELISVTEMTYSNYTSGATGRTGVGGPLFGDIAVDQSTGIVYGFDRISDSMTTLRLTTGKVTTYGPDYSTMTHPFIGGAAMFDSDNNLYMVGSNDDTSYNFIDTLYRVNKATGEVVVVLANERAEITDGASCSE